MVNIYEKLVDNTAMGENVFGQTQDKDPYAITMGWDDSKGNDRPYYKYKQSYKDIVTYEPPMHLLSSFSYDITRTHGSDTNEKVSAAGPKKAKGGKRKTQKKKQPKQKRAGSTKKTKKAKKGGKTSQKKGKQQSWQDPDMKYV